MNRTISAEQLNDRLAQGDDVVLLDVRRPADYAADTRMIPGASWHDPDALEAWSEALPRDKEIIVYCVRGGAVSNAVVDHLQQKNLNARFIEGGILAWRGIKPGT